jgi:hypothetical protein
MIQIEAPEYLKRIGIMFLYVPELHPRASRTPMSVTPPAIESAQQAQLSRGMGLGDLVAKVAQPIARAIDAVAGTDLANCTGCAQRKAALNKIVPNVTNPMG